MTSDWLDGLRSPVRAALAPIVEAVPLDRAMPELLPSQGASAELVALVSDVLTSPELRPFPLVAAALWLYVDELDRSHRVSQQHEDALGCAWHAVMHRREGDFGNSKYWWTRAGDVLGPEFAPERFVDEVARAQGGSPDALLAHQRREWSALMRLTLG